MILLKPELAQNLEDPRALRDALQVAVELEHATIPAYLYALYSIEPGANQEVAALIRSVVVEEMTHMGLVCNIINAIGGAPEIGTAGFIPTFPGPLPGSVETGLVVHLRPLSLDLVENVFMVIEEPEHPLTFHTALEAAPPLTIGQFYAAIAKQLAASGEEIFTGDPHLQVVNDVGDAELVAIKDLKSALAAIEMIVEQGEGTTQTPTDEEGGLAHYYRFSEIVHGRRLVANPNAPADAPPDQRYVYGGDPIPFDPAGVRSLTVDPTSASYAAGTQARLANDNFNYAYTSLLTSLRTTFNGSPHTLMTAIGLMESCKQQALDMGKLPVSGSPAGEVAGPSFQYQPTNP